MLGAVLTKVTPLTVRGPVPPELETIPALLEENLELVIFTLPVVVYPKTFVAVLLLNIQLSKDAVADPPILIILTPPFTVKVEFLTVIDDAAPPTKIAVASQCVNVKPDNDKTSDNAVNEKAVFTAAVLQSIVVFEYPTLDVIVNDLLLISKFVFPTP